MNRLTRACHRGSANDAQVRTSCVQLFRSETCASLREREPRLAEGVGCARPPARAVAYGVAGTADVFPGAGAAATSGDGALADLPG